jgi:hypothetical protein
MVFKKKTFKQKIGTKTNLDDVHEMKRFTNGHKCFTSAEAGRMVEQQSREAKTAIVFEKNRDTLTRPRNPMTGEETPRSGAEYKQRFVAEYPLIQENRPPAKYPSSPKGVTLKPGVMEPKEGPITEDDVNAHEEEKLNYRIDSLRNLQDNVGGELLFLQKKMQDRKRQVNTSLVTNFISSQRRVLPNSHYR